MNLDAYAIVILEDVVAGEFVLLSYPGMETNGTVVIAPLLQKDKIAIVTTLHPLVETPFGDRVVAVERLAAVSPHLITPTAYSLIDYEYDIQRAMARLFFGN